MHNLTPEGRRLVDEIANRHAVSAEAVLVLLEALMRGGGNQAQFNHPELGGMGQWSRGGMIMVGDMFNQGLKYRVDALCNELAALVHSQPPLIVPAQNAQSQSQGDAGTSLFVPGSGISGQWWPAELGNPSSSGAQNDMRYAFFPDQCRLAIQQAGQVRVYETGNHNLYGFSQQQGGDQSLTFTSQFGLVRVADLPLVSPMGVQPPADQTTSQSAPAPFAQPASTAWSPLPAQPPSPAASVPAVPSTMEAILKAIEGLAVLREKGILTDEEFAVKKTELLSRL